VFALLSLIGVAMATVVATVRREQREEAAAAAERAREISQTPREGST